MTDYVFKMSAGDTSPVIEITCKNSAGVVVPVTGAQEVRFKLWNQGKGTPLIDNTANTSITDGPGGKVDYTWQNGDTDTPGVYLAKFVITYSDGSKESFPNAGRYIKVTFGV